MGSRHASRKLAMQVLYQAETRSEDVKEFLKLFVDDSEFSDDVKEFGEQLAVATWECRESLDKFVEQFAIGWSLDRISLLDLSILRLAFYELNKTDLAAKIILNEAVELAKEFSSDDSPKFINGILGKFVESDVYRNR